MTNAVRLDAIRTNTAGVYIDIFSQVHDIDPATVTPNIGCSGLGPSSAKELLVMAALVGLVLLGTMTDAGASVGALVFGIPSVTIGAG